MKILLAIDSSPPSQEVVNVAAIRPWPAGTIFCVISIVDMGRWEGLPALIEDARREAERSLKDATEKLTGSGHQVFSELQMGFPKKAISEYAKQWGAGLIMVGSHGQSALTRFLLGSVAQAVLRSSPCSVEVVRSSSSTPSLSAGMKILVATDGSEGSAQAVYSVANRPWPANSEIKVISVVQLLTPENQGTASPLCSEYPTTLLEQIWKEARARAEEAIADARKILTAKGLTVHQGKATPVGDARPLILDEAKAWGSDLIVLGSHGRHGLDRMLIGSVSESVALHAHCSVEVARR
jgi:nucleotide-binding universal stress UspA family protein